MWYPDLSTPHIVFLDNTSDFDHYRQIQLQWRDFSESTASRWLKRNAIHFVRIILPRQPAAKMFRLTPYDRA